MFSYPGLERENHVAVGTLHIPGRAIVLQTSGSPLAISVMETSENVASGRVADGVSSECDLGSGGREGREKQSEREMGGGE